MTSYEKELIKKGLDLLRKELFDNLQNQKMQIIKYIPYSETQNQEIKDQELLLMQFDQKITIQLKEFDNQIINILNKVINIK